MLHRGISNEWAETEGIANDLDRIMAWVRSSMEVPQKTFLNGQANCLLKSVELLG